MSAESQGNGPDSLGILIVLDSLVLRPCTYADGEDALGNALSAAHRMAGEVERTGERIATTAPTVRCAGREHDGPCRLRTPDDGWRTWPIRGTLAADADADVTGRPGRAGGPGGRSGCCEQDYQPFELADFLVQAAHGWAVGRFQPHGGGEIALPGRPVPMLALEAWAR
jgi:hypothetical protein